MTATGVHSVDLLIHLFGRIDEVYCLSHRRFMARLEDTTAVLFSLANGMSATLYCSLVTAVSTRFAVFGTKGCAELWTPKFQFRFSNAMRPTAADDRAYDSQNWRTSPYTWSHVLPCCRYQGKHLGIVSGCHLRRQRW